MACMGKNNSILANNNIQSKRRKLQAAICIPKKNIFELLYKWIAKANFYYVTLDISKPVTILCGVFITFCLAFFGGACHTVPFPCYIINLKIKCLNKSNHVVINLYFYFRLLLTHLWILLGAIHTECILALKTWNSQWNGWKNFWGVFF